MAVRTGIRGLKSSCPRKGGVEWKIFTVAKETLGNTAKQRKQERTLAKAAFTKKANYLIRAADGMIKHELQEELSKLSSLARNVNDANDDYMAGLLADTEAVSEEGEEVKLGKDLQTELERTMEECHVSLDEIREAVRSKLWARYGIEEIDSAIQEAGRACERAHANPITAINRDGFELQLKGAKTLINYAISSLKDWEKWIPHDQATELEGSLKDLRAFGSSLEARIPHCTKNCRRGKKRKKVSTTSTDGSSTTSNENKANHST